MLSYNDFIKEYLFIESVKETDRNFYRKINNLLTEANEYAYNKSYSQEELENADLKKNDKAYRNLLEIFQNDPSSKEGQDAINTFYSRMIPYISLRAKKYIAKNYYRLSITDFGPLMSEIISYLHSAFEGKNYAFDDKREFDMFCNATITGAMKNFKNPIRHGSIDTGKGNSKGENKVFVDSLDKTISGDRGEWADRDMKVADEIPDESSISNIFQYVDDEEKRAALEEWLSQLPETEKTVLQDYYFRNNDGETKTLTEIGKDIGMTAMGVKKLLDRTVDKLRRFAVNAGFVEA